MKFGIRKPSLKRKIKAKTTGKMKRSLNKAIKPGYGKKGMGILKNPEKAAYNKVYHKTTTSIRDIFNTSTTKKVSSSSKEEIVESQPSYTISAEELYEWDPDFYPNKEENEALNLYYDSIHRMSEFRKTNPSADQINLYIKNSKDNFKGLKGVLKYWERVNQSIPPNVPIRSEAIDILMRCNKVKEAKKLYEDLKCLGVYDNCPELELRIKNMIEHYPENINAVIEYISNNMGVEQTKARKELNEKIDSTTLTRILNRSYFISKKKKDGKNFLYLNDKYAYN
ncbi:MAG: hypothetical protein SOU08_04325 [Anaerococcus sp.]|nr:hypothetical protein [Anaerococcus sp.]MDD7043972.1 hypothetical protein [Peptoniphilaceae bacterium]MDY2918849.1 hypothetical protein [Anaerococcus sp.]